MQPTVVFRLDDLRTDELFALLEAFRTRTRIELWGTTWDVFRLRTELDRSSGVESFVFEAKPLAQQEHHATPDGTSPEDDMPIAAASSTLAKPA